ncbi:hypothetical protein GCM10027440_44300 [Nocardiopsis coralliicola]
MRDVSTVTRAPAANGADRSIVWGESGGRCAGPLRDSHGGAPAAADP